MTHFAEAVAHAEGLIQVGCTPEEAVVGTVRAFELNEIEADLLECNVDLFLETYLLG